ncbi:DUF402 domain-containing protein [Streptomyces sp. NPDC050418]|uniref:DUF402 domain-containing protein n=1 Tax=Streptomyces sp. NPDC050418 TaxID=3365612 RepID=UPI0037AA9D87
MTTVTVDVRKYDGRLSARWETTLLGTDEHGTWLGTAKGVPMTTLQGVRPTRFPYVLLAPPGGWWIATFCAPPGPEIYCDVCTPVCRTPDGSELHLVDLDLDVVRLPGAEPHVEDEDEFAAHRRSLGYPDALAEEALRTCAWLHTATRRDAGQEPFASAYRPWLARVVDGC